jgi:two-component system OmpR family response regulator
MPSRILIAEEEMECSQLFQQFLQRCGYEVTTVHDGMGCLDALQDGFMPSVLVLSWELPCGEGEGVLDWLRQQQGNDDIAVVVLTARMDADAEQQEISLSRVTWLQRPFRLTELLTAVQSAEKVPRNSWRCLEALWKRKTTPLNDALLNGLELTNGFTSSDCGKRQLPNRAN